MYKEHGEGAKAPNIGLEGGPLNQPGGHWERAATCKLKGMGSRTVQLGVGEFH